MAVVIALKKQIFQCPQNRKLTIPNSISLHETQFLEFTFYFMA